MGKVITKTELSISKAEGILSRLERIEMSDKKKGFSQYETSKARSFVISENKLFKFQASVTGTSLGMLVSQLRVAKGVAKREVDSCLSTCIPKESNCDSKCARNIEVEIHELEGTTPKGTRIYAMSKKPAAQPSAKDWRERVRKRVKGK